MKKLSVRYGVKPASRLGELSRRLRDECLRGWRTSRELSHVPGEKVVEPT
ncbi:MAG: hypothetical protein QW320_08925 [Ignisphaera sp.]